MKNHFTTFVTHFSYDSSYSERMRVALACALFFHILLLALIPNIPDFKIPSASREAVLNVFLNKIAEPEEFEQVLNQQNGLENTEEPVTEPSLGAASPELGDDSQITEETPSVESSTESDVENESTGNDQVVVKPTRIIISWSALQKFTDLEVANYSQSNPDELARFSRTFSSSPSYRRRADTKSYKNQYGDYYVRNSSSSGDICFKQEREQSPNELSTKTVYFFRCDDGPTKLEIKSKG